MTDKTIKDPRRLGPVARAVADLLQAYGITGARYYKGKHFRVEFELFDKSETIRFNFACTPRDDSQACRIYRRKLEKRIMAGIAEAP